MHQRQQLNWACWACVSSVFLPLPLGHFFACMTPACPRVQQNPQNGSESQTPPGFGEFHCSCRSNSNGLLAFEIQRSKKVADGCGFPGSTNRQIRVYRQPAVRTKCQANLFGTQHAGFETRTFDTFLTMTDKWGSHPCYSRYCIRSTLQAPRFFLGSCQQINFSLHELPAAHKSQATSVQGLRASKYLQVQR